MALTYAEALSWLEARGGVVYSSQRGANGFWECSLGGLSGMTEVACTGYGANHEEAFLKAAQELQALEELLPNQRGPTLY